MSEQRMTHIQTKITLAQFHILPSDRFGDAKSLASKLGISRASVNTWMQKGVFKPRFIVVEGSGGKTTFVYDLEDCAHVWGIRTSAHTRTAKAQALLDIESFWASRIPQYIADNETYIRPV